MNKSLSFELGATKYYLLVGAQSSDKIWLERFADEDVENEGYYAEETHAPLSFDLPQGQDMVVTLIEKLRSLGLVTANYRELARTTKLLYSYIDDTPAVKQDDVCLYVDADPTDTIEPSLVSISLAELSTLLEDYELPDHVVRLGVSKLSRERVRP